MFFKRKKSSTPGVKAQQQLSPAILTKRTLDVDSADQAAQHPALFAQWQNGDLRPSAITLAFDPKARGGRDRMFSSTQFVGPWVDEACGTREPGVDRWEKGLFYPTWEQLCKLSALTETSLGILLNSPDTPNFLNGCSQVPTAFALRQVFHPLIVTATVNAHPHQAPLEDMTQALNQAIAAILQSIEDETDPLTLCLSELQTKPYLGEQDKS
uniref:hypothetical protein n=1 Tax=Arthrobacter sp. TaxID=1667 RepID=UPI00159EDE77|nr:hypothetical protein [Arthrobacter sp.]